MSETMYAALEVQTERARNAEAELALMKQKLEEVRGYLVAASDGSMSRNNSEQLASELLAQIDA